MNVNANFTSYTKMHTTLSVDKLKMQNYQEANRQEDLRDLGFGDMF